MWLKTNAVFKNKIKKRIKMASINGKHYRYAEGFTTMQTCCHMGFYNLQTDNQMLIFPPSVIILSCNNSPLFRRVGVREQIYCRSHKLCSDVVFTHICRIMSSIVRQLWKIKEVNLSQYRTNCNWLAAVTCTKWKQPLWRLNQH